jgi:NTE family protein
MKIGLVLSGGGARGFAHLGVLKALEEMDIKVSAISGTSAGAIAGAFYCSGYPPDEIFSIISATGFLKSVRPAWSWTGLLSLDGFKEVLYKYLPENSFESLKLPLTIATTEIRLGKVTYFNSGELIPRVIASASIPALFNPMVLDGHVFVDGGIMDNLPVRPLVGVCDFIIGSHCNPVQQVFDVKNMKEVTERSLLIAINVNSTHSKTHCNVVIEPPELGKFTTFDLAKAKEIYEIGYTYTHENYKEIETQINQLKSY